MVKQVPTQKGSGPLMAKKYSNSSTYWKTEGKNPGRVKLERWIQHFAWTVSNSKKKYVRCGYNILLQMKEKGGEGEEGREEGRKEDF